MAVPAAAASRPMPIAQANWPPVGKPTAGRRGTANVATPVPVA